MMKSNLFLLFFGLFSVVKAQVSESCDCVVDTAGYSNYVTTLNINYYASFNFNIHGTFAVAFGVIDGDTPSKVQNLIDNHPTVTTIIMHSVPGSMNDNANLQASQLIYNHGYKMYLPHGGFVASGGTDMLLAGSIRVIEITQDAVGVHSWAEDEQGNVTATDYPVGHANHQPYINYYMSLGFSQSEAENFYYFTINSAPFSGVHWMTQAELDLYKVRSCRYSEAPEYSVSNNGTTLKADLGNKEYQWINCSTNQPISGETTATFTPQTNGEYAVIVTETGCQDTSECMAFSSLNIVEDHNENAISLINNPNVDYLEVVFQEKIDRATIQMIDMRGRYITKSSVSGNDRFRITKPKIKGVYILEINTGSSLKRLKWINE